MKRQCVLEVVKHCIIKYIVTRRIEYLYQALKIIEREQKKNQL